MKARLLPLSFPVTTSLPFRTVAFAAALLFAVAGDGAAQTYSWNGLGTSNNWSDTANWVSGAVPVSATGTTANTGPIVQFTGITRLNSAVDSAYTLQSLTFTGTATGAYHLTGSDLTFTGSNSGGTAFDIASSAIGNQITIDNNLVLASGLTNASFRGGAGGLILNGNISMGSSLTGYVANNAYVKFNGILSGSGSFLTNGDTTGTIYLNGVNTYTGSTQITAGTVIVSQDAGTTGGALGNNSTAVFMSSSSGTTGVGLLVAGAHTISRTISLATAGGTYTYGGTTADISSYTGNLSITSTSTTAVNVKLTAVAGGRSNFSGNIQRSAASTAADTVTKTGAGIVALSGTANKYLGKTEVAAGTLLVNGSIGVAGDGGDIVTVDSGATLGGTGTIYRAVTVSSGGALAAGDANVAGASMAGTLTLNSGLTLASGSTLNFDLGTSSDEIVLTGGNLTLAGTLNLTAGSGFGAGTYTLFNYGSGALSNNGLAMGTTPAGYSYTLDTSASGLVQLDVAAVPEPKVWGLGLLGVLFLVARRRAAVQAS